MAPFYAETKGRHPRREKIDTDLGKPNGKLVHPVVDDDNFSVNFCADNGVGVCQLEPTTYQSGTELIVTLKNGAPADKSRRYLGGSIVFKDGTPAEIRVRQKPGAPSKLWGSLTWQDPGVGS